MTIQKGMLVIGSPRGTRSNSHSLGSYLMGRLEDRRVKTSVWLTSDLVSKEDEMERFLEELDQADLLVLVFPLYIDSLPALNIRLMECIVRHREGREDVKSMAAIVNSGFPEKEQSETALRICRNFSTQANMDWKGGLALGFGMAIGARPLKELGGMARNITKALDSAAEDLFSERPISNEAKAKMRLPMVPRSMLVMFGKRAWGKMAKKNGVEDLDEAPYGQRARR